MIPSLTWNRKRPRFWFSPMKLIENSPPSCQFSSQPNKSLTHNSSQYLIKKLKALIRQRIAKPANFLRTNQATWFKANPLLFFRTLLTEQSKKSPEDGGGELGEDSLAPLYQQICLAGQKRNSLSSFLLSFLLLLFFFSSLVT